MDAGRGIVASSIGLIGVLIFSFVVIGDISESTFDEKQDAFRYVIGVSSFIVFLTGVIVYMFLNIEIKDKAKIGNFNDMKNLVKSKSVILIGLIILTAYMGYKITDIYSLYASEIMLFDEIEAARVGALQQYLRPLACISIAFFADKSGNINVIITGFVIM